MSIISQLAEGKITWSQAETQVAGWFGKIFAASPPAIQADVTAAEADAKQVASDALGLADTALGPIISAGALAVEGAATVALTAAGVGALSPAADAAISNIGNALKTEVDLTIAKWRAGLVPATMAPIPNPTPPAT